MKKPNDVKNINTYQKNRKSVYEIRNYREMNKVSNTATRSNTENGHILEQILSDMAWYG